MAIERFVLVDEVTAATSFAINQNGQDYRVLPAAIKTYLDTLAGTADGPFIQYSAPSATGFSVQINDDDLDVWLVLTPIAGYAAGTLILPTAANATSGQEITVNTTQSVTTLTITGNGASVIGAPTTLAANAFFTLRFEPVLQTWYRVS